MFSLWDLFVNQIAGGFLIAVLLIMMIFAIILAIGGVSLFSTLLFSGVFAFAMSLGYGQTGLTTINAIIILSYFTFELHQLIERGGG